MRLQFQEEIIPSKNFIVPVQLCLELGARRLVREEVDNVSGRTAVGYVMNRLSGPRLPAVAEVAKMLQGHFHAEVVLAGQSEHSVDPLGLLLVIYAALRMFDIEERIAQP